MRKPKILVIGMGGTITAKKVKGKWKYGEIKQEELIAMIPGIAESFDITTTNIFRMDSSDMKPKHWLTLASTIYYHLKDYDGIVVTMGRDTIHYADTAIAFLLQNLGIPVVFTASLYDPNQYNTDALNNLKQAILVAGKADIAETMVVLDDYILRATRTEKVNASEYGSFAATREALIGKIQGRIKIVSEHRKRKKRKVKFYSSLETNVTILKLHPGFDAKNIMTLIDEGIKGIVLEGYGFGNIPLAGNYMKEAVEYANKKNVPIVVTSECFLGEYWQELYNLEIGDRLKGLKVIPAYDMLTTTAFVKLMWVLGQTKKYGEVKKMMQTDYCGEIIKLKGK